VGGTAHSVNVIEKNCLCCVTQRASVGAGRPSLSQRGARVHGVSWTEWLKRSVMAEHYCGGDRHILSKHGVVQSWRYTFYTL
jgi:hypothetical protein